MATRPSDISIRIGADTQDVRKELAKLNIEVKESQRQAANSQRRASNATRRRTNIESVGSGFGSATKLIGTGLAIDAVRRRIGGAGARSIIGTLGRTGAKGIGAAIGGGLGRTAAGSLASAGGSVLLPILAIAAGIAALVIGTKLMVAMTKKLIANANRQSVLMGKQLRESFATRQSMQETQALARMRRDPLGRSLAFQRQRIAALGTGITALQTNQLSGLAGANLERDELSAARGRSLGAIAAPFVGRFQQAKNLGSRAVNSAISFQEKLASRPALRAFLRTTGVVGGLLADEASLRNLIGFGGAGVQAGRSAEEERRSARFALRGLRRRGPGNILNAPATIQAGSEEEHAFRVDRQRIAQQREINKVWQDRVIRAMERLVELGELTPEQVELQKFDFTGQLVGV